MAIANDERIETNTRTRLYGVWLANPPGDGPQVPSGRFLHAPGSGGEEDPGEPLLIFMSRDTALDWLREAVEEGAYETGRLSVADLTVNVIGSFTLVPA